MSDELVIISVLDCLDVICFLVGGDGNEDDEVDDCEEEEDEEVSDSTGEAMTTTSSSSFVGVVSGVANGIRRFFSRVRMRDRDGLDKVGMEEEVSGV